MSNSDLAIMLGCTMLFAMGVAMEVALLLAARTAARTAQEKAQLLLKVLEPLCADGSPVALYLQRRCAFVLRGGSISLEGDLQYLTLSDADGWVAFLTDRRSFERGLIGRESQA